MQANAALKNDTMIDAESPTLRDAMRRVVEAQYAHGYRAGHAHGRDEGLMQGEAVGRTFVKRAQDRALGVGVLLGTGVGVALTIAALGFFSAT